MMKRFWHHPIPTVICNIALMMVLFTLSRIAYFLINHEAYPNVTNAHLIEMLVGGMRFDLTAVLYLSSVYLLLMLLPLPCRQHPVYQTVCRWFYLIPNIIGLAANSIDTVYTRFTDRRTTMAVFSEFRNDDNIAGIILQSMVQYWYVSVLFIVLAGLCVWLYRPLKDSAIHGHKWVYYVRESLLFIVSVYMIIMGIRGGFGAYTRPITLSNALQYTNTPAETNIVLNTPFAFIRAGEGKTYKNPHYYAAEELEEHMSPLHQIRPITEADSCQQMNVVVIILESFSKEYIGFYNHDLDSGTYLGYTPFLDSLLAHSITYKYSFASGRKSIDAMPSVLSSLPMLISPYVLTPYSTNAVMSVASCLKAQGYTTAFFHGAPNGSMGFQAYARTAGFESYYGMNEYDGPAAFDGTWAIWDEEFLQFYARTMNSLREPFMTAVFTASSHHPFRVPERYEGLFPQGTEPIHPCIGYSDNALRQFFCYAAEQPWFERTLFVLTADHTNQLSHPIYTTAKGLYEVPIAFYCPSWGKGQVIEDQAVSQTDIMPSVLACVGYDKPFVAFGEDVLTQRKAHPWAICYNSPVYEMISDRWLLLFDGIQLTALYDHTQDLLLQNNVLAEHSQDDEVQAMTDYLKAFIQQYIARMTDNRLTIEL